MKRCEYCGEETNSGSNHIRKCPSFIGETKKIERYLLENSTHIHNLYTKEEYSIQDIVTDILKREYKGTGPHYYLVVDFLKGVGIYGGRRYGKRRQSKIKETTLKRHGTMSLSPYTERNGQISKNKIEYKKVSYLTDLLYNYEKEVAKETKKSLINMEPPRFCAYTGIRFVDDMDGKAVNPNDPTKRTIDHKIPVIWGYLNGIPASVIGGKDNLVYVIRYINTIKGNTLYESFIPIALKVREAFKNEGYESN